MRIGELAQAGLGRGADLAAKQGIVVPPVRGKLLRPLAALCLADPRRRSSLDDRFWLGCLAIQMAHEASLHHDDVLDGGFGRRGGATLAARKGPGAALLLGDLYLTGSYRVAHQAGAKGFLEGFLTAVEATARGERMQCDLAASDNPAMRYEEMIRHKSGALFGIAAALPGWFGVAVGKGGVAAPPGELRELGIRIGALYQRIDDFLDYCPAAKTGKPKLQDFANRVWTWVLGDRGPEWFDQSAEAAVARFFGTGRGCASQGGGARNGRLEEGPPESGLRAGGRAEGNCAAGASPARVAMNRLEEEGAALARRVREFGADELAGMVEGWIERCRRGLQTGAGGEDGRRTEIAIRPPTRTMAAAGIAARACALGPPRRWGRFFARHSRTFSFAARLFPETERRLVRGIYAFCRFTDDLVDGTDPRKTPAAALHRRLDAWTEIARSAYNGAATGIPLADVAMGEMAARRIPFALASELIEGVRMDVEPRRYATMEELRGYTHRVASVVGIWLTRAFGVGDPGVLERAADLGHAMQLTNIIRDVGEDLARGRIYLPADRMEFHGVTRASLVELKRRIKDRPPQRGTVRGSRGINHGAGVAPPNGLGHGPAIDRGYAALIEEMMAAADASYAAARQGIPFLPPFFRRPVAVAAEVYQGIHDRVRANGYDNLNRRAYTRFGTRIALARRGLAHPARTAAPARLARSGAP